jgi:hypothetical protein
MNLDRPRIGAALVCAAFVFASGSCTSVDGQPSWAQARLNDLLDSAPLSLSAGPGFMLSAHATVFGTGFGVAPSVHHFGWPAHREAFVRAGDWHEFEVGILIGAVRSSPTVGHDVLYFFGIGPICGEHGPGGFQTSALLDLEASAHVGILGARFGVSPIQFADLIAGVFGIDFLGDDRNATPRPGRYLQDVQSSPSPRPETGTAR